MNYSFKNVKIDCSKYNILVGDNEVQVEPQVFNLIIYLLENRKKIVSKAEILIEVWNNKVVSDNTINNCIKLARKVLGDDGHKQAIIRTIRSRGYQFVASIDKAPRKHTKIKLVLLPLILMTILAIAKFGIPQKFNQKLNFSQLNESEPYKLMDMLQIVKTRFPEESQNAEQRHQLDQVSELLMSVLLENNQTLRKMLKDKPEFLKEISRVEKMQTHITLSLIRTFNTLANASDSCSLDRRIINPISYPGTFAKMAETKLPVIENGLVKIGY